MKPKLVLHIGLSKTGSSSIQRTLAGHRDVLTSQGVYLPSSPGHANHALLAAAMVNDRRMLWGFHPGVWEGMSPDARIAQFRAEFAAEMQALPLGVDRMIITAEQIGGLLRTDEEVEKLRAFLQPFVSDFLILLYLRRQDQHAASAYSQWLRGGLLRSPKLPDGDATSLPEYDYAALIQTYREVFGEDAVRPRLFERKALHRGDVVEDFCRCLRLKLGATQEDTSRLANTSLSTAGQELTLFAATHLEQKQPGGAWRDSSTWRQFVEFVSRQFPGQGWRPTQGQALEFMRRFEATNEWVRGRYFPERDMLFDMDVSTLPEEAVETQLDLLDTSVEALLAGIADATLRDAENALAQFRLYKRLDDLAGMQRSLKRAIKLSPDLVIARSRMVELCLKEGKLLQAKEHLEVALRLSPELPELARLRRRLSSIGMRQANVVL